MQRLHLKEQKTFLIEAKADDSEWSEVIDQLANLLIKKSAV